VRRLTAASSQALAIACTLERNGSMQTGASRLHKRELASALQRRFWPEGRREVDMTADSKTIYRSD